MSASMGEALGFPYEIVRSKRKSAAIHVKGATVQVRIPHFVDDAWALRFLCSKSSWVKSKLVQQAQQSAARPVVQNGEALLWLGEPKQLSVSLAAKSVRVEGDQLFIGVRQQMDVEGALQQFFKHEAKAYMVKRTHEIAAWYGLEHKLKQVRFRRTKTKWGHCTSKGDIQYNWLIMGAPLPVIDYLICHEVCHLQHPNHSKQFWQCVSRYCPDYKQLQSWLKHNSLAISWC